MLYYDNDILDQLCICVILFAEFGWQYTGGSYMKNKRFLSLVLAIVLTASLFVGVSSAAYASDSVLSYSVVDGDYVYKICVKNGLSYYACKDAIKLLNGFTTETQLNRIYPGQTIKLPASDAVAATIHTEVVVGADKNNNNSSNTTVPGSADTVAYYLLKYDVKSGDSLYSICNSLGTSYAQYSNLILTLNNLTSAAHIYAGKTLYIPVSSVPSSGSTYYSIVNHKVTSGETMTSICNSYGVNYSSMSKVVQGLNDGYNMNAIKVGQTVLVPTTKNVTPTTSPTATVNPTAGSYTINFATAVHGSPYAMIGTAKVASANKGNTVNIEPNPDSGYVMKSVTVVKHSTGAAVAVTSNSFTMPEDNVDITVLYETGDYTISSNSPSNGSFEVLVNGVVADCADNGDKITLAITPDYGYKVDSVTYSKTNGLRSVSVKPDDKTGVYSFMMPDHNIKVAVKFTKALMVDLELADINGSKNIGALSIEYDGNEVSGTKIPENTLVTVKIDSVNGYGPNPDSAVNFKPDNGSENLKYETTKIGDNSWTLRVWNVGAVSNPKIFIYTSFIRTEKYELSVSANDGNGAIFRVVDMPEDKSSAGIAEAYTYAEQTKSAKEGQLVFVIPRSVSVYEFNKKADDSNISVVCGNGKSKVNLYYNSDCMAYYFEMPASNTTASLKFTKSSSGKYSVVHSMLGYKQSTEFRTLNTSGAEQATFAAGDTIAIDTRGLIPAGYTISNVDAGVNTYNDWTNNVTCKDGTYYVKMPAATLWIIVYIQPDNSSTSFVDIEAKALNSSDGTELSSDKAYVVLKNGDATLGSNAAVGTEISIVPVAQNGYELEKVEYKHAKTGTKTEIQADSYGKYRYTVKLTDLKAFTADKDDKLVFSAYFKRADEKAYMVSNSQPDNGVYLIATNNESYTETKYGDDEMAYGYAGRLVTLFIKPDKNFRIESVEVNGEKIPFANTSTEFCPNAFADEYSYYATFTMPESNAVTKVTFVAESKNEHSIVNNTDLSTGTLSIKSSAVKGEKVTFTCAPNVGYEYKSVKAEFGDGTNKPTVVFTEWDAEGNPLAGYFMMDRDEDVKIRIIYQAKDDTHEIKLTYESSKGELTITASPSAAEDKKTFAGDLVAIDITPKEGYKLKQLTITPTVEILSQTDSHVEFLMPGTDVNVAAAFIKEENSVSVNANMGLDSYKLTINGTEKPLDEKAVIGDSIKLKDVTPAEGYKLTKVVVDGVLVGSTYSDGVIAEIDCGSMSGEQMIVSLEFEKTNYALSYTVNVAGTSVQYKVDGSELTSADAASEVYVKVIPTSGMTISKVKKYSPADAQTGTAIAPSEFSSLLDGSYHFTMPYQTVRYDVEMTPIRTISIYSKAFVDGKESNIPITSFSAKVNGKDSDTVGEGDTFTLTATQAPGYYEFDKVLVNNEISTETPLTSSVTMTAKYGKDITLYLYYKTP